MLLTRGTLRYSYLVEQCVQHAGAEGTAGRKLGHEEVGEVVTSARLWERQSKWLVKQ